MWQSGHGSVKNTLCWFELPHWQHDWKATVFSTTLLLSSLLLSSFSPPLYFTSLFISSPALLVLSSLTSFLFLPSLLFYSILSFNFLLSQLLSPPSYSYIVFFSPHPSLCFLAYPLLSSHFSSVFFPSAALVSFLLCFFSVTSFLLRHHCSSPLACVLLLNPFISLSPHFFSSWFHDSPLLSFLLTSSCFLSSPLFSSPLLFLPPTVLSLFPFLFYSILSSPTCSQMLTVCQTYAGTLTLVMTLSWAAQMSPRLMKNPQRAQHHLLAGLLWIKWSHKWNLSCKTWAAKDVQCKENAPSSLTESMQQVQTHTPAVLWTVSHAFTRGMEPMKVKKCGFPAQFPLSSLENGAVLNKLCHLSLPVFLP